MIAFDDASLADVIARANGYATTPIVLGDPSLGSLRVSGRFRIDEPAGLSRNLARLFGLSIDTSRPDRIILDSSG